jgi:hypothetical protein
LVYACLAIISHKILRFGRFLFRCRKLL